MSDSISIGSISAFGLKVIVASLLSLSLKFLTNLLEDILNSSLSASLSLLLGFGYDFGSYIVLS